MLSLDSRRGNQYHQGWNEQSAWSSVLVSPECSIQRYSWGSLTKPKLTTNDYGISAGGPVFIPHIYNGRDKTFFFSTYEGFRSPQTSTKQYSVPTAAMKQGNFSGVQGVQPLKNPFNGGTYSNFTVSDISSVAQKFLQFFPDPNVGDGVTYVPGAKNYITNKDSSLTSNQFDIRGDQYLGSKALIFGRFTWKNSSTNLPQSLAVVSSQQITQDRVFVGAFNYAFNSNLQNEFRFGLTLESNGKSSPFDGKEFTTNSGLQGLQNLFYNGIPELDFNNLQSLDADRLSSTNKSVYLSITMA